MKVRYYFSLTLIQQQVIDDLIARSGGMLKVMQSFGWQGGTIHQVRDEVLRKWKNGIVDD